MPVPSVHRNACVRPCSSMIEDPETALPSPEMPVASLKTAPRGYDRDHPQIALLQLQRYAALRRLPLKATREDITAIWRTLEPLLAWVERYAGPATTPAR